MLSLTDEDGVDFGACREAAERAGMASEEALDRAWRRSVLLALANPINLRRHLRLLRRTRLRPLRRARIELSAPPGLLPDCERCTDRCCTGSHVVNLRLPDVARLDEAGLGLAISRAEQLDWPTIKHLDHRCVFLEPAGRCAIYPIRPLVCRSYPYQVDEDRKHIRFASTCRSRTSGQESAVEPMVAAAIGNYNRKIVDAIFCEFGSSELSRLGLDRYYAKAGAPSLSRGFDAILDRIVDRRKR